MCQEIHRRMKPVDAEISPEEHQLTWASLARGFFKPSLMKASSQTSGQQAILEREHMFVVPRHTLSREVIPKNENVFVSRGKGAETLSSAVAVKTTATAEESAPAPFPRLTKTFSFSGRTSRPPAVWLSKTKLFSFSGMTCRVCVPRPATPHPPKSKPRSRSKRCPGSPPL